MPERNTCLCGQVVCSVRGRTVSAVSSLRRRQLLLHVWPVGQKDWMSIPESDDQARFEAEVRNRPQEWASTQGWVLPAAPTGPSIQRPVRSPPPAVLRCLTDHPPVTAVRRMNEHRITGEGCHGSCTSPRSTPSIRNSGSDTQAAASEKLAPRGVFKFDPKSKQEDRQYGQYEHN